MFGLYHPWHLVSFSPWPYVGSLGCLGLTVGTVMFLRGYLWGGLLMLLGLLIILLVMIFWWRDVIREGSLLGCHTFLVLRGLNLGMLLFILSEVMFFVTFFWGFWHSSLGGCILLGSLWPPLGIIPINAFDVPLCNTVLLLTSGGTITLSHYGLILGDSYVSIIGLFLTLVLGLIFTLLQGMEYYWSPFTISDSTYGSTFFLATGFHGLHVLIGTTFLLVCLVRMLKHDFTLDHHTGFILGIWYWHFVDVVWVFLFLSIYWWGG